jgi:hypothetical protein
VRVVLSELIGITLVPTRVSLVNCAGHRVQEGLLHPLPFTSLNNLPWVLFPFIVFSQLSRLHVTFSRSLRLHDHSTFDNALRPPKFQPSARFSEPSGSPRHVQSLDLKPSSNSQISGTLAPLGAYLHSVYTECRPQTRTCPWPAHAQREATEVRSHLIWFLNEIIFTSIFITTTWHSSALTLLNLSACRSLQGHHSKSRGRCYGQSLTFQWCGAAWNFDTKRPGRGGGCSHDRCQRGAYERSREAEGSRKLDEAMVRGSRQQRRR